MVSDGHSVSGSGGRCLCSGLAVVNSGGHLWSVLMFRDGCGQWWSLVVPGGGGGHWLSLEMFRDDGGNGCLRW